MYLNVITKYDCWVHVSAVRLPSLFRISGDSPEPVVTEALPTSSSQRPDTARSVGWMLLVLRLLKMWVEVSNVSLAMVMMTLTMITVMCLSLGVIVAVVAV